MITRLSFLIFYEYDFTVVLKDLLTKRKANKEARQYLQLTSVCTPQVPIFIPVLVLIISIYLVIGPIIDSPKFEYLYATLFILAGLVFYFPFVYFKKSVPGMGKES